MDSRALSDLVQENRRLRQKVFELEEQLVHVPRRSAPAVDPKQIERVMDLVRQKDAALGSYAQEVEEKTRALQATIAELRDSNVEMQNGMVALRLYQQIFENEPSALVGFDVDRNVVQFNKAAVDLFGQELRGAILQDVFSLPLAATLGADVPDRIRVVLETGEPQEFISRQEGGMRTILIFPLSMGDGQGGGMLRVGKTLRTP